MKQYTYICFIVCIYLLFGCNSSSRKWYHRANDTVELNQIKDKYMGVEVDLIFSNNTLYVGHDIEDTIKHVEFKDWFKYLENSKTKVWIDIKSDFMSQQNAPTIVTNLKKIIPSEKRKDVFIECRDERALKIVKDSCLYVCLWLDDICTDTTDWLRYQKEKIGYLQPFAISCEHKIVTFVSENFPEQKIFTWLTPTSDTNIQLYDSYKKKKNIQIILLDHPFIDYE